LHQRRLAGRLRFAKLPARKTLEQFDYSAQPGLDRRLIDDLATLRFIEEKANVLLIGPPGVGKTMLATALGYKAVEADYRAYYTTAADHVAVLERAAGPDHRPVPIPRLCRQRRAGWAERSELPGFPGDGARRLLGI